MNLINLTPHSITIEKANGQTVTIPPSGTVARCAETRVHVRDVDGIAVSRAVYGDVTDLPDPQPDTIYIVSALVALAARRDDVLFPGPAIRDAEGKVIGCWGLSAA